jgi:hypothetical protein
VNFAPLWAGDALPEKTPLARGVKYSALPLSFEANQGQVDGQVKYLARGRAYTLFLTGEEAVLRLKSQKSADGPPLPRATERWPQTPDSLLRLRLVGANTKAAVTGGDELPGKANYFIGNDPSKWRTNVRTYARVRYANIYPGVDLVYYGNQDGQLEYDFAVAPGADPAAIRLEVRAQGSGRRSPLRIAADGDLLVPLEGGDLRFHKPVIYQPSSGQGQRTTDHGPRTVIPGRYILTASDQVRFALGPYDHAKPLVIDPYLDYSTYLGGSGSDVAYAIAVDSSGDAYVAGIATSINFPITTGAEQTTYAGDGDVFVTEFNPTGTGLTFSTYLGGSEADTAYAILLGPSGTIYIAGSTLSPNFPTTSGVLQSTYDGNGDAFLTELNPTGSSLVYSTYLGGSGADSATAMALDGAGNVFLTGSTTSTDFPTVNPLQLANAGNSDAFVAEVNPTGSALLYSTYLGGSNNDYGTAIAVVGPTLTDLSTYVYVSGYTYSTNFPTQNAYQSALAGGSDVFITELIPGTPALLFSTFLGGTSDDYAFAMALDISGNIYLTGETQSNNFPVTANAFQSKNQGGPGDAFVTKLAPGAAALVYSTLLGGSGTDQASALALDSSGDVYIAGFTQSSNFPLLDPLQEILGISGAGSCGTTSTTILPVTTVLCPDAFVAEFGPSGAPIYSTYLGGSQADAGQAIVVDSSGAAYVAGSTSSSNFPATAGTFQWAYTAASSGSNAFVAKINPQDVPALALSPQQINFGNQEVNSTSVLTTVTLTNEGSAPLDISGITVTGDFAQTNNCGTIMSAGGSTCTMQVGFTPTQPGQEVGAISISDNSQGTPQPHDDYITLTGNGIVSTGSLSLSPTSLAFSAQVYDITSPAQSVVLINDSYEAVTVTNITVSGDFAQTNTCGNLPTTPTVLNVGQACTISITFTPTASGTRSGSLAITSSAAKNPSVTLTGIGLPQFTLSANTRSSVLLIGTTSSTFTIAASAPSSFTGSITLACASGASCSFNPTTVIAGQTSTLTVNQLTASTANPMNFTVNGTSGTQTASVGVSIFFADFSLSATPSGAAVTAGNSVTYTVTVTPSNGFNQPVILSCSGIPTATDPNGTPYTRCIFAPPGVTPTGSENVSGNVLGSVTATLTITTTAQSGLFRRWRPRGGIPPGFVMWPIMLMTLGLLMALTAGLRVWGLWLRPNFRFALLIFAIILAALGAGCETYVNPISVTPVYTGTATGNYVVILTGTLGSNSSVSRTTRVNLSVAQ